MTMPDTDLTNRYAGPFCGCGDHSCPAGSDSAANCVNQDWPVESFYPADWNGVGDWADPDTWGSQAE